MRGLARKCVSTVDCLPRPQIWIGPEPQVAQQGTSGAIANENAVDDDLCRHALASIQGPLASSRPLPCTNAPRGDQQNTEPSGETQGGPGEFMM